MTNQKKIVFLIFTLLFTLNSITLFACSDPEEKDDAKATTYPLNSPEYVKVELKRFSDTDSEPTYLPFEFASPEDIRGEKVEVGEGFYTILEDSDDKYALIGPLSPCIFIGFKNTVTGRTLVAHKQYTNKIETLIPILQKELKITSENTSSVQGMIWSAVCQIYNQNITGTETSNWKTLHKNHTQTEEIQRIRDILIRGLSLQKNQVNAQLYNKVYTEWELGNYYNADRTLLVTSDLKPKSFSPILEADNLSESKIMKKFIINSIFMRDQRTYLRRQNYINNLPETEHDNWRELSRTYESLTFIKYQT